MAGRKLVRDLLISRQPLLFRFSSQQQVPSRGRLWLLTTNEHLGRRQFSVFNEFSKQIKGEAERNQEFKKSVKELKEKAEELKGVKEDLKVRTKQTTEKLYKQVDGVWTEAEATAKKVSSSVKEKVSAAAEEVKESFGFGKQESSGSSGTSAKDDAGAKIDGKTSSGEGTASEETHKQTETGQTAETFFGKIKSSIPSSAAFQKLKEARVTDVFKKGYDVVKDEIYGNTSRRKHLECTPPPAFTGEISSRTDIVVQPPKQTIWGKKWDVFREKVKSALHQVFGIRGHPLFKRFTGISEPVVTKGQEIAEDMRERWETSDSPIVHKIQDVSETIFQETDAASSFKEISRRDPSFSMMDFVAEVQEAIRPVLDAYSKGDVKTLKKYCSPEVIDRCLAERKAFQSHGFFFDNKILHISEVEVRDTKLMGASPIIVIAFQTQQIHCVRDKHGEITEGGKDTIHTVYYMWAMQQVDPEELGEGSIYPIWRLREMQRLGVQALI